MIQTCITCTSSRAVVHGPRSGSLWCLVKSKNVNPDSACPAFPKAHFQACQQHGQKVLQRVLVKSAAEFQNGTRIQKTDPSKSGVVFHSPGLAAESQFETDAMLLTFPAASQSPNVATQWQAAGQAEGFTSAQQRDFAKRSEAAGVLPSAFALALYPESNAA